MTKIPYAEETDRAFMLQALTLAEEASRRGEVPVGALVVCDGQVVGEGFNLRESHADPLGHAELIAIAAASKHLSRWRLSDCTLYVTLEPCAMCAGALVNSRMGRLVFGAADPKAGAVVSLFQLADDPRLNHRVDIQAGICEQECGDILKAFFKNLREKQKASKDKT